MRWLRPKAWVVLVCVAVVAVAGCGGDDEEPASGGVESATPAGVKEAERMVADAEGPITEPPSVPPFDPAEANGKKVWFVSLALAIPYSQQVWRGVQQGSEALGVDAKSFDGKFSPADVTRGIDLAIQDKADAIILHALPADVVGPALKKAEEAGVHVISAETQNPGPPLPQVPESVDGVAGHSYSIPAELMAAKVVADSGGDANVLFLSASDIGPGSGQGSDAFVAKMEELCPDCEVKVEDSPVAQWAGLTESVPSMLRANPDVDYLVPIFDGMVVNIVPGIRSAGAQDRVKVVSGDATQSVLQAMESGDVVIGDVGQPNVWTGVGIIDQTARVLVGEEPLEDIGVQYRLFTDNNIGEIDLQADPSTWYGDVDFLSAYREIWGLD